LYAAVFYAVVLYVAVLCVQRIDKVKFDAW
jgi:hypothetical protein